ncbi:MAG: SDR family oxidoreductase [Mycobacterium sp.]|nr:SDR family oxidoreductase [Mycobacterium sp.]
MLFGMAGVAAASGGLVAACQRNPDRDAIPPPQADREALPTNPADPDYYTPQRFTGKTIVVTGCARGMGAAAARRAAREGANIVGVDWIADLGTKTITDIVTSGGNATFVEGDVGLTETCDRMVKVAVDTYGGLDLALNNAGVMDGVFSGDPIDYQKQKPLIFAPIHEATDEYWDRVFQTNSAGVFKSMRAELRQMVTQGRGGAIVNVSSIAGMTGLAGNPAYVASKHAVNGLTRNAAIDYAPYGIRVNSVNMSATDTPMVERAGVLVAEAAKANPSAEPNMGRAKTFSLLAYADPQHRPATVAEQVSMMLFLLSGEASNFTGGVFPTDGGWTSY